MSWLSELFGGGGEGPGERMWAQYYADAARRVQEQQQQDALLAQYQALQPPPPTPEEQALKQAQTQQQLDEITRGNLRQQALSRVSGTFGPDFEQQYAPTESADPFIQQAYGTQRQKAEDYLTNLLKRNVITQGGYAAGEKAIEEQAPRVRTQLGDIANTILAQERGGLTDIANRAKGAASTLDIGQTFDPSAYQTEAQKYAGGFNLGDKFAASVPTTNLFDVSALPKAAGAAQGAQNLAFDPAAVAGTPSITDTSTEDQPVPKKRTAAVF